MTKSRNIKSKTNLRGERSLFPYYNDDDLLGYQYLWKFNHRVFRENFLLSELALLHDNNDIIDWCQWWVMDWTHMETDSQFIPKGFSYIDQ